jgi:hypothetical protein
MGLERKISRNRPVSSIILCLCPGNLHYKINACVSHKPRQPQRQPQSQSQRLIKYAVDHMYLLVVTLTHVHIVFKKTQFLLRLVLSSCD